MSSSEPDTTEQTPPKVRKLLLILFLLVVVGAPAGAWYAMSQPPAAADPAEVDVPQSTTIDLDELTVALDDPGRYVRVQVSIAAAPHVEPEAVEGRQAALLDAVITTTSGFSAEALQGEDGLERLRTRLHDRAEDLLAPAAVDDVLFREFLVQ